MKNLDFSISGDWTEDFSHENGQYMCRCHTCNLVFIGHKRRPLCKVCSTAALLEYNTLTKEQQQERLNEITQSLNELTESMK